MFDALSDKLQSALGDLRGRGVLDEEAISRAMREVRLALLEADVNFGVVKEFVASVRERALGEDVRKSLSPGQQVVKIVHEELTELLGSSDSRLAFSQRPPTTILLAGLQGSGKTTTIGKLAAKLRAHGHSVLLAAADTFRAAAEEQLEIWAQRSGARFVGGERGGDPAAVAYDAVGAGDDVVIVDTAGRLHTQTNLMEELAKVHRVIAGRLEGAPHETLLVVDATTGQNGVQQARLFGDAVGVTGVVLTKLDGSAKGGVAIPIAYELGLPVKLVGVGEALEDLQPFDPADYARALVGG